jgi:hypothetical protein
MDSQSGPARSKGLGELQALLLSGLPEEDCDWRLMSARAASISSRDDAGARIMPHPFPVWKIPSKAES